MNGRWKVGLVLEIDADNEDEAYARAEEICNSIDLYDVTQLTIATRRGDLALADIPGPVRL